MTIYLAGGNEKSRIILKSLNSVEETSSEMKIYLVGNSESKNYIKNVLLSSTGKAENDVREQCKDVETAEEEYINIPPNAKVDIAILESFYYANDYTRAIIPHLQDFLLDSGAFTFFTQGKKTDWDKYVDEYAEFITQNSVEKFFELDIDALVGYERVLQLRKRLEQKTGKQCIPVWHKSRGKAEFIKMCEEYSYVALGGIVSKEIKKEEYKYFPWFIEQAHRNKARIHGLGFTNLDGIRKYHFDSVDSTSWTSGNRFGSVHEFNGTTIVMHKIPRNTRLSDAKRVATHNFNEWVKFQKYAKTKL